MPSGHAQELSGLPARIRDVLSIERRGVMTTIGPEGHPHAVPVVFADLGQEVVSPIDHKPKQGVTLARVRNLQRDDRVTLLVDHWAEDWTRLVWVMIRGRAAVDPDAPIELMRRLNARYAQYAPDERHDALIRIKPAELLWWAWT
jgi:PPOX class probable F420-dependent enzyme